MKKLVLACLILSLTSCSKPNPSNTLSYSETAQGKPAKDAPFIKVPLGLSEDLKIPAENPLTPEKVMLGHLLYFDKRISLDGTVSCATCHNPKTGWSDEGPVSTGIKGQKGTRRAPTSINSTYMALQFWDGRAKNLEEQALGPMINPIEMGNPNHDVVVERIRKIPVYVDLFQKAFGAPPSKENIAQAIGSFERTVLSGNSKYDQFVAGNATALNESEKRGKDLFFGKAMCVTCHNGPTFSDSQFHNLGVGMNKPNPDLGRYTQTKQEKDKGAFKTPGLRDVALHAPYMHDGSQKTLEEVIEFYDQGGEANPQLDPLVRKLNLTPQEKTDLVNFMKALNGSPYPTIAEPKLPN